jgi:hypothetical protein
MQDGSYALLQLGDLPATTPMFFVQPGNHLAQLICVHAYPRLVIWGGIIAWLVATRNAEGTRARTNVSFEL